VDQRRRELRNQIGCPRRGVSQFHDVTSCDTAKHQVMAAGRDECDSGLDLVAVLRLAHFERAKLIEPISKGAGEMRRGCKCPGVFRKDS